MEEYYPAELPLVLRAWGVMCGHPQDGGAETVDPMTFFATGGERIDS